MTIKVIGGQSDVGAKFSGTHTVPGDKSISHRSVILGAIAQGTTEVSGFLTGEDCLSTIRCFRALGVDIQLEKTNLIVDGGRLFQPSEALDVGNSGTTLRLMTGLLAGQALSSQQSNQIPSQNLQSLTLTGDASIQKRPMNRVIEPLTKMGADISGAYAPVTIRGKNLEGISYTLPVASAQVKSAILLAGLNAKGSTVIEEPIPTRDHTEIMLQYFGADITKKDNFITLNPSATSLQARPIIVPGDISSAAFLMAAAAILPGANICIEGVGVNPTRTGIIHVLRRMGADIQLKNERIQCGEAIADITIRHAPLKGVTISGAEIPTLIDEIPAIAAVALFAEGKTIIKDAAELKVKETDRIRVVADEFNKFAFHENKSHNNHAITPHDDGMAICGGLPLYGAKVNSHGDHRLAMSLCVAALCIAGETQLEGGGCADISFPGFYKLLPYVQQTP